MHRDICFACSACCLSFAFANCFLAISVSAEDPYQIAWARQIGSSEHDSSNSVAVDNVGNVYIAGETFGDFATANAGNTDVFLTKYDAFGNHLWSRQIGTSDIEHSFSVAVDMEGNPFVSGYTNGSLDDGMNSGSTDSFLTKYDPAGDRLWLRQFGTSETDNSNSVAIDAAGNAYVTGSTFGSLGGTNQGDLDVFLTKYDAGGAHVWSRQIGTAGRDQGWSVAIDWTGNPYIAGSTTGGLAGTSAGSTDAFLIKYDSAAPLCSCHFWLVLERCC